MDITTLDLSGLTEDGDTVDVGDGTTLRLRFEPDDATIEDIGGDWYGELAPVNERVNDYGYRADRPDGFDGNAEILSVGRSCDRYWWQPPADVKRTPKDGDTTMGFAALRRALIDLLEYGYSVMVLEECKGTDAYGRPIVTRTACLGGIEPFPDAAYVSEVVNELAGELS